MKQGYEDIMDLPHHRSSRHAPLSMESRAAQFAPFAALTGYEDALVEAERQTEHFQDLDDGIKAILDAKLQMLEDRKQGKPMVTIRYFVPDERKEGGRYMTYTGVFRHFDATENKLIFMDGTRIPVQNISAIINE